MTHILDFADGMWTTLWSQNKKNLSKIFHGLYQRCNWSAVDLRKMVHVLFERHAYNFNFLAMSEKKLNSEMSIKFYFKTFFLQTSFMKFLFKELYTTII